MTKHTTNRKPSILNSISVFNSISKCMGFAITKPNDTFLSKSLREIAFLLLLLFALFVTVRSELWCMQFLNIEFDVKKLIIFVINQVIILSPLGCLLSFRLCHLDVWKIILKIERLEKNLIVCNTYLDIGKISSVGLLFWLFQVFIIMSMMYYSLWPTMIFFIVDSICMFYFEVCVIVPYFQFVVWIWFLCYVSYCVQCKIVEIINLEYFTQKLDIYRVKDRLAKVTWDGCGFARVQQIKKIIGVLKQVLNIAKEISSAYGITVLIYIVHYLSRVIIQFYDVIDKDAHKFPMWMAAWNVIVRIIFILPVFVCCEHLTYNINKTVQLIQEIVTLHQPSCLDCIFQSLTLRLQHQNSTTQICGFLNITYRSFLTIMTTALAFLLLQLQF